MQARILFGLGAPIACLSRRARSAVIRLAPPVNPPASLFVETLNRCSGLDTLRVGREHALQWLAVPGPEEQEQLCADVEARRSVEQLAPSLDRCFLPDSLARLIVHDARETEAAPAIFVEQFDKMFSSGLIPFSIALERRGVCADLLCDPPQHRRWETFLEGPRASHARPG
jgi:hypothetical protein